MKRKTVVLVVASQGYQPVEYGETKKALEDGGMSVMTASNANGMAIASDNTTTNVDLNINNILPDRYDGIFFIGGPGAMDCLDNQISYTLCKKTVVAEKLLGAICITPRILAKAGVLTGKKATGWDDDDELANIFKEYGATYEKKPVVVDGTFVTATGPAAAQEFGKAILDLLKK